MICKNCNSELAENASFCHICGTKVGKEKQNSNKNWNATNIYTMVMLAIYGIALFICFICNLAIDRTLSWFFIVLVSILLSFSITNLPFLLKKYRLIIPVISVTVMVYILLFVCSIYTGGDWLLTFAYPIATYSIIFAWLILLIARYRKANWGYKTSIILVFTSIFTITSNPFIDYLLGNEFKLISSFVYDGGAVDYSVNGIIFFCMLACALISLVIGIYTSIRKRRGN